MEDSHLVEELISQNFSIIGSYTNDKARYFEVRDYYQDKFADLVRELDLEGYVPFISPHEDYYKISIAKKPESGESRIHINVILFLLTLVSTIFAGYILGGNIWKAMAFSVALLAIIGTHETAHFLVARKNGVKATLPYFIPAPTIIGTFGAVINIKSPIPTLNSLFDLGYSGPLAGILVAIPVLLIGLHFSTPATNQGVSLIFTPPLLMTALSYLVAPNVTPNQVLLLHPVAFAGWVGILVTMLNLMPVAFLDGGHISRSLFNQRVHRIISIVGILITIALGWFLMAILMIYIFLKSKSHPGALDNVAPVTKGRKIMAVLMLVIFILCLSPFPFTQL
jgi:membrane-associated protease RseP (regulator of RpoE activity)